MHAMSDLREGHEDAIYLGEHASDRQGDERQHRDHAAARAAGLHRTRLPGDGARRIAAGNRVQPDFSADAGRGSRPCGIGCRRRWIASETSAPSSLSAFTLTLLPPRHSQRGLPLAYSDIAILKQSGEDRARAASCRRRPDPVGTGCGNRPRTRPGARLRVGLRRRGGLCGHAGRRPASAPNSNEAWPPACCRQAHFRTRVPGAPIRR